MTEGKRDWRIRRDGGIEREGNRGVVVIELVWRGRDRKRGT